MDDFRYFRGLTSTVDPMSQLMAVACAKCKKHEHHEVRSDITLEEAKNTFESFIREHVCDAHVS